MKSMSFDPMKDLTSITTAIGDFNLNMQGGPPRPDVEPLIILKGNFDVAKMETALSALISAGGKDKVAISKIGERTMFEMKEGQKPMFGTFVDKDTVVMADSKDKLQTAIDKSEGKKTTKLSKEFETALAKERHDLQHQPRPDESRVSQHVPIVQARESAQFDATAEAREGEIVGGEAGVHGDGHLSRGEVAIDAPEIGRGYDTSAPFGREARERLTTLLLHRWVRLEQEGAALDVYHRRLAYVMTEDGQFINALLVREGLARVSARVPLTRLHELQQAEAQAQAFRRGMWGVAPSIPPPSYNRPSKTSRPPTSRSKTPASKRRKTRPKTP
jgi:micrococcal nuclease